MLTPFYTFYTFFLGWDSSHTLSKSRHAKMSMSPQRTFKLHSQNQSDQSIANDSFWQGPGGRWMFTHFNSTVLVPIFPPTIFSIPSNACGSQKLLRCLRQKKVQYRYLPPRNNSWNFQLFAYSQLTYTQHMLQINLPPVVNNTTKSPCSFQGPNLQGFFGKFLHFKRMWLCSNSGFVDRYS